MGSFGEVQLAVDKKTNKKIAIKSIKTELAQKINIDKLSREFYLMSKNHSPFIADVYEFHFNDKKPYFIMEYIEGKSLQEYFDDDKHRFSELESATIIASLAAGLEHIHSTGIIHGDLKPSNIIITKNGNEIIPRIIDFGLADDGKGRSDISGSLGWMAPEKLLGKSSGLLADIYSLALITLEILTGINPFLADNASETIEKHLNLIPQIPRIGLLSNNKIRKILKDMLDKNPHKRPTSSYFLRVAIAKISGLPLKGKSVEAFLPHGTPMLDDKIKMIIDELIALKGKKFIKCNIEDTGRFDRFKNEIAPELSIRGFKYFEISEPRVCAARLLSDVLSSEPEKRAESHVFSKAQKFREKFGEYISISKKTNIDRMEFLSSTIDLLEEYSFNVPLVLNAVDVGDEMLLKRLSRMKNRGKILILTNDSISEKKVINFESFDIDMTQNYLLSVLNPYEGDNSLFEIIHRESFGQIDRIDNTLRKYIVNGLIKQSQNGWVFDSKTYSQVQSKDLFQKLSESEIRILKILLAAKIELPSDIFHLLFNTSTLFESLQSLMRFGLLKERFGQYQKTYYSLEDREIALKIAGDIDNDIYRIIAEAIEDARLDEPRYLSLRIEMFAKADIDDSWLSLANDTIKALKSSKSYSAMLSIYLVLADFYNKLNSPVKTFSNLKKAGLMCKYLGRFSDANDYYDQALAIAREVARKDMLSAILNDIGVIHFETGALELALSYYRESAHIAEIDDNTKYILLGWSNIAGCLHLLFDFEEAEEFYRKALDLAEDSEYSIFAPVLCFNLGEMRLLQYDTQEAKRLFNRAITLSKQGGQKSVLYESLIASARLQLRTGSRRTIDKTIDEIDKMIEIKKTTKYHFLLLMLKLEIAINRGDYTLIEKLLRQANEIYPLLPLNLQSKLTKLSIFSSFIGIEIFDEFSFNEIEDKWQDYDILLSNSHDEKILSKTAKQFYQRGDIMGYVAMIMKKAETSHDSIGILQEALSNLPIKQPFLKALLLEALGKKLIEKKEYDEAIKKFNLARVAFGKASNEEKIKDVEKKIDAIKKDEGAITGSEISNLLEIIRSINSKLDFDEVISRILTEVIRLSESERGIIFLKQAGKPVIKLVMDNDGNLIPPKRIKYSHSIVNDVFDSKSSILKESVLADEDISTRESVMALDIKMVFCIPLIYNENILGAIYTDSKIGSEAFSDTRRNLLETLAANASIAIHNAQVHSNLITENMNLRESFDEHFGGSKVIGRSLAMRKLYHKLSLIADEDITVLLTGETGTGKDLIARTLHSESPRHKKPFIAINCAALPDTLLESELFGYEKGAFTGATMQKKGKFDLANGGTIFLNEIGEMPLALQAKLLSVLETKTFQRLGGTKDISVDARIIAATNRKLKKEVENGNFRSDLYYRLSVITLHLPPLRNRRDDIPALIRHFINQTNEKTSKNIKGIAPKALDFMLSYEWPGNIREMQNLIEEMSLFSSSDYLTVSDIPSRLRGESIEKDELAISISRTYDELKEMKLELERNSIIALLNLHDWNIAEAAKHFGINRTRLHQLVTKHGLRSMKES